MRFRWRLAKLTSLQFGLPSEQTWDGEIRTTALQLQKALQVSAEYIFAQFPLDQAWKSNSAPKAIAWKSSCCFSRCPDQASQETLLPGDRQQEVQNQFTVGFQMYNRDGKWSISSHQLEAVLGLWSWSSKRSELLGTIAEEHLTRSKMIVVEKSKRDEIQAALYLWVTQSRKVRQYGAVGCVSRPDNLSIPTSTLLSRAQSSKQSSGTPGKIHASKRNDFTILGIPTDGSTSLLQLMAQDVYTVFINRIVDIVEDLRGDGDPEDYLTMRDHSFSTASRATPLFELTNPHIDALANTLVSAGVATREEALMSIVPAFLNQMKLPLMDEDMVQNLLERAKFLRRNFKFREGAVLITWMLSGCPVRFHKQGLRCLGDLHRRAALSKKRGDQDFGLRGMGIMKKRYTKLAADDQIVDILNCYEFLSYDFSCDLNPPKTPYAGSGAESHIARQMCLLRQSGDQEELKRALTLNKRFYLSSEGADQLLQILRWAIGRNYPELIEDLWTNAILLEEEHEFSPLLTAFDLESDLETFHSLLDWPGIDINGGISQSDLGDYRRTPFVCAIEANRADVVCSILRKGAHLHQRNEVGMTPLQCAFRKSNEGMIQLLLKKGAVKRERGPSARTALHFAAESNSETVIRWLLKEGDDIHEIDKEGRTALHFAAQANGEAVVQLLLENGAQMHGKDGTGRTALHFAAKGNCEAVIRLLLEKGAGVHEKDAQGRTPLHLAAERWDSEGIIRLLLENGAGVRENDAQGRTPLHLAASGWKTELLLENRADTYEDQDDRTALHVEHQHGHRNILRLLFEKDAEIGSVGDHGWSEQFSVIRKYDEELARLLKERGIRKPLDNGGEEGGGKSEEDEEERREEKK